MNCTHLPILLLTTPIPQTTAPQKHYCEPSFDRLQIKSQIGLEILIRMTWFIFFICTYSGLVSRFEKSEKKGNIGWKIHLSRDIKRKLFHLVWYILPSSKFLLFKIGRIHANSTMLNRFADCHRLKRRGKKDYSKDTKAVVEKKKENIDVSFNNCFRFLLWLPHGNSCNCWHISASSPSLKVRLEWHCLIC